MSRGRRREHYQLNMDVWGVKGIEADVEILAILVKLLKEFGLTSEDVGLKVSNRMVVDSIMDKFLFPKDCREKCFNIIDKLEKCSLEEIVNEFKSVGVEASVAKEFINILKLDVEHIKNLLGKDDKGSRELDKLFNLCQLYGLTDWVQFDGSIVRGLSYYTGTVFEGFDRSKTLRAICGGGRYDGLLNSLGYNHSIPAVGFGFGDAVIVELLKDKNLLPDFNVSHTDVTVFAHDSSLIENAIKISSDLRGIGLNVDMILEIKKPKWVFQRANKLGINHVIYVAPDELATGNVVVRDMKLNAQSSIPLDKLASHFKSLK